MLGLSVSASAAFDAEDSQNINHINTNVWKLTSAFVDSVASFTWDQNNNAQLSPAQYFAYALSNLISDIGSMVTGAVSWITSYVGAVTGNPLILAFVIVAFVGLGVGLINRLIKL